MWKASAILSLALLTAGQSAGPVGAAQASACRAPMAPPSHVPNIFSEDQENDLGDAIAEHIGWEFRVIDDDDITAYLRDVGARIVQHLPLTKLHFQFFLVDLPDANAFVLPGGRIYISRKLIALTQSEDELAAVIGHETGHLVARQQTAVFSRLFKDVLGVTAVGDRADVFEKYNEWMDNIARHSGPVQQDADDDQMEADLVGLYAMAAAGYDPQAHARFFDRLADTRGNTGGFFSNLFGTTNPDAVRLKEILKHIQAMPAACIDVRVPARTDAYQRWKSLVIGFTGAGRKESLHGVSARTVLDGPLRIDVTGLRFSPDGRFILAQDDGGITVLTRDPFQWLFRIDAVRAAPAQFSPDSRSIVFHTADLRVERWDLETGALAEAHEVFIRKDCLQSALSPDGRMLVCLDGGQDLTQYTVTLVDVASGAIVYTAADFTGPDTPTRTALGVLGLDGLLERDWRFATMMFSSDGRFFVAAHHRDPVTGPGVPSAPAPFPSRGGGVSISALTVGPATISARDDVLIYDVARRTTVSARSDTKRLIAASCAFIGVDRLLAFNPDVPKQSAVIELPGGDVIERTAAVKGEWTSATKGRFVFVRPYQKFAVGVLDLSKHEVVKGLPNDAIDIFDEQVVAERGTGELALYGMDKDNRPLAAVTLPAASLSPLAAAAVSSDFKWLAVSERSRGAVWDLETGDNVTQTRPFDGAAFTPEGLLFADFSRQNDEPRKVMRVDPSQKLPLSGVEVKDDHAVQIGPYLVIRRPARKGTSLGDGMEIEVRDVVRNVTLWTRAFDVDPPLVWTNPRSPESIALTWPMTSNPARAAVRSDPALARQPAAMRPIDADLLVEAVDLRTGSTRRNLIFETGNGSFAVASIQIDGGIVAVADSQNRVHILSLDTGELRGRVFGNHAVLSPAAGAFVVENGPGTLTVYDAVTLRRKDAYSFSHNVSVTSFSPDGRRLFVLTADQTAYVLDLTAGAAAQRPGG